MIYNKHLFFCINQKPDRKICCNNFKAEELYLYAKNAIKELGPIQNKVKVNSTKCLGKCSEGPVLVIYPEGTWYYYKEKSDIEEILHSDIKNNQIVKRLLIKNPQLT